MKSSFCLKNLFAGLVIFSLASLALAEEKAVPADKEVAPAASAPDNKENTDKQKDKKEMTKPEVEEFSGSTLSCVMGLKSCSFFSGLIHNSGLEDMLGSASECTVFAPSDAAFSGWSAPDKEALASCPAAMAVLVLNHVCPSVLSPEALREQCKAKTDALYDEALEVFGKDQADKCKELCCRAVKKFHEHGWKGSEDGPAARQEPAGKEAREMKAMPEQIFKCDNGYVYVVGRVQIPRVLKVYKKLAAAQNAPEVIIEEVSVGVAE